MICTYINHKDEYEETRSTKTIKFFRDKTRREEENRYLVNMNLTMDLREMAF